MVKVTVKGLSSLQSQLNQLSDNIVIGTDKAAEAVAEELARDIELDTPIDTGALLRTVNVEETSVVIGGSQAPYAEDVEEAEPFIRPNIERIIRDGGEIAADVIKKEI